MKKSLLTLFVLTAISLLCSFGCSKSKQAEVAPTIDPIASGIETSQTLIQEGDPVNGIRTLEELNQQYPNQEEILEALAFAHTNQNNHLEAAFYFESIAKLDNTQSNLFLQAARSYEEEKEHDSALRCYNRYLDTHPADGKAWKAYAKVLIKKQQYDHALQAYTRALATENGKPTPFEVISIGKLYFKKGDLAQANDWYELGKSTAESRPYALLGQAEIRIDQEKLQEGETLLHTLIQEYPTFKTQSPYLHLVKKLQTAKAKQAQQVAEANRRAAEAQAMIEAQAEAEAAAEALTIAENPEDISADPLAVAENTQSSTPSEESNSTEPQAPTSQNPANPVVAQPHTNENNVQSPETTSPNTHENTPVDTPNNSTPTVAQPKAAATVLSPSDEAELAFKNHDMENAIRLYWKAIEADPKAEKNWLALSEIYFIQQDFTRAQSTALEAMRLNPNSETAAMYYVNLLSQNKNRSEFFTEINKLKQQFPNSAPLALEIGKSYEHKLNNPRNAYYTYLQFLQKNPTHSQKSTIEAEARRLYGKLNLSGTK